MRNGLAVGSTSFTNIVALPYGVDFRNSFDIRPNGNSIGFQFHKGLFKDTVGLRLSSSVDGDGFSAPVLQASTGLNTRFRGCQIGFDTSIDTNSVSITPKINFRLQDDIMFAFSTTANITESNVTFSTNTGLTYTMMRHLKFGIYFNTNHRNTNLSTT
jgi:hypothetical protein